MRRYLLDTGAMGDALTLSQCRVVSEDTDLLAVPGLSVVNWTS